MASCSSLSLLFCFMLFFQTISKENGNLKALALRKLALQSESGLIKFNATGYRYFIEQEPRPYDVVMFFTTGGCGLCDQLQNEFTIVQEMYKRAGALYPNTQESLRSVFFAVISFSHSTDFAFQKHGFSVVPNIVYYSNKLSKMKKEVQKAHMKDYQWTISANDGHITSSKILEFINQKSKRNVVYKEPILKLLFVMVVLGFLFIVLIKLYKQLYIYFLNPKLWFVASMIVYTTCLGGVVYTVTQGQLFSAKDQQGNLVWYMAGRGQYGMEGVVMSVAISFTGLMLLFTIEGTRKVSENSLFGYGKYIVFLIGMALTLKTLQFVDQMHLIKQNYQPSFYPPAHFTKGPLMKDQGNSF